MLLLLRFAGARRVLRAVGRVALGGIRKTLKLRGRVLSAVILLPHSLEPLPGKLLGHSLYVCAALDADVAWSSAYVAPARRNHPSLHLMYASTALARTCTCTRRVGVGREHRAWWFTARPVCSLRQVHKANNKCELFFEQVLIMKREVHGTRVWSICM